MGRVHHQEARQQEIGKLPDQETEAAHLQLQRYREGQVKDSEGMEVSVSVPVSALPPSMLHTFLWPQTRGQAFQQTLCRNLEDKHADRNVAH